MGGAVQVDPRIDIAWFVADQVQSDDSGDQGHAVRVQRWTRLRGVSRALVEPAADQDPAVEQQSSKLDPGLTQVAARRVSNTRAVELELDFTSMTARKVWEYRHDPDIFTAAVGRVMRLDNGNTLVNFGFGTSPTQNDPNVTHHIVEVTRDGVVMADIELKSFGKAVQYRSHVMPSISGERIVTAGDYYEDPSAFEADDE